MPFTELVTPQLIPSDEAPTAFSKIILPALKSMVDSAPGYIFSISGRMLIENNAVVPESNFHPVLGVEWNDPRDFYNVVRSKDFPAFGATIKPYLIAPPSPEVYETDASPRDIFASPITDVFRINIRDDRTKEAAAKTAWIELVKALGDVKVLSGVSINLSERLFLGMIGWSGIEQRDRTWEKAGHLKENLEKLNDVRSFVAQFDTTL